MSDASANYASVYVPNRRERFWRSLGFRFHLGDEPEGVDALSGWMRTDTSFNFGWFDRFRLLLTGRLRVSVTVHFDTPSPAVCKSRIDWRIVAPREAVRA